MGKSRQKYVSVPVSRPVTLNIQVSAVMLETDRSLSYVIKLQGGCRALMTLPGRQLLCLRCRQFGQIRKYCKEQSPHEQQKHQSKIGQR